MWKTVADGVLVEDADTWRFLAGELLHRVVVVHLALRHLLLRERHVEVSVEVAAVGRHPIEPPAHPFLERLDLGQRRSRNHHHGDVACRQVRKGAVDMVGHERAARAALLPIRSEHEVVDNQLAASGEEIC